ncbi:hypothetical protein MPL1032_130089 [Mesorhizobium plurifarium]|uniref:Uncharacterized protein n=1 Tax=Mesorhizobium plurifarium TaxID=69974 RepID=A0A0K2VQA6_MESPL|nr:hypothetical protein MPL1032_130089 [Mesorhizobium plurifarium]
MAGLDDASKHKNTQLIEEFLNLAVFRNGTIAGVSST